MRARLRERPPITQALRPPPEVRFARLPAAVPLIIKCAGGSPGWPRQGAVVDEFTEHVDILPTIMEAVGLPVPAQADGSSLLPFLHETGGGPWSAPEGWRTAAHWEFDFRERDPPPGAHPSQCSLCVLRGHRFKYVQFADEAMPPLLFDVQADPGETVDLASSLELEHVAARADCASQMLQWRMRHAEHSLAHMRVGVGGVAEGPWRLHQEPKL